MAPIGYIAMTKAWSDLEEERNWLDWWQESEDVRYVQFMAKDNLPFHTIMFPAMTLGTGEPWKLADQIKGFNWLNYYGEKFSTSAKRGIFLDRALDILPSDCWRYTLLATAPESSDSTFTWEQLQTKVNKDLADKLGNLVNRVLKFAASRFDGKIPTGGTPNEAEQRLQVQCQESMETIAKYLYNLEFRKATDALCALWTIGNQYVDEQAPWKLFKENPEQAAMVIRTSINLIRIYAIASKPFIPATAEKVSDALNLSKSERNSSFNSAVDFSILQGDRAFSVPEPLFQKLDDEQVTEFKSIFGNSNHSDSFS